MEWVRIPREGFEYVTGPQARTLSEKRLPSLRITPEVHHGNDDGFHHRFAEFLERSRGKPIISPDISS
jgi:hypothetical protein